MEELLHYVWQHRLFQRDLKTIDGRALEIIDIGLANTDSGPDFFNAKVKIADQVWSGNIEIHTSSKDWYKHKHDVDKAYNSVILHIVEFANGDVSNQMGQTIPQCEIKYPTYIKENIEYLLHSGVALPCAPYIASVPSIHLSGWLNTLLLERMERKAKDINVLLERFHNSWDDVLYTLLSRNFGFGLNSDAFERLALSLPLRYILKQADSLPQIEAMLLGQAGMLNEPALDVYTENLQKEYLFLKNKYELAPLDVSIFKNMRMRPTSFPQVRIAQLAATLFEFQGLFSKIIETQDVGRIRLMLHKNASEYWQTHYLLGQESPKKNKYIGDSSLDVILINTVAPITFAYGKKIYDEVYCERALSLLESLKPESNSIVRDFAHCKLCAKTAYETQALIQLKREYCEKRKCLFCRIGYQMLSKK